MARRKFVLIQTHTMPALVINIRIDAKEKLRLFEVTLADIACAFDECHIKIRGRYAGDCLIFARTLFGPSMVEYQHSTELDWVMATSEMVGRVSSRSLMLYFEDHKLVAPLQTLQLTLQRFDELELDYLCYSFFRASKLDGVNLLPLDVRHHDVVSTFELSQRNAELLGRISPGYYRFSLLSVVSKQYMTAILNEENSFRKLYSRAFNGILARVIPLRRRRVLQRINVALTPFDSVVCLYDPASPFNLERMWYERIPEGCDWKYGVLTEELFANYDDDNGAYGESLIKRGKYPFPGTAVGAREVGALKPVTTRVTLNAGESFDCTYHAHVERIRQVPIVRLLVMRGEVNVTYRSTGNRICAGESSYFHSNLGPLIHAAKDAEIAIDVYDELLQ
jgi:hypothetical protein